MYVRINSNGYLQSFRIRWLFPVERISNINKSWNLSAKANLRSFNEPVWSRAKWTISYYNRIEIISNRKVRFTAWDTGLPSPSGLPLISKKTTAKYK